MVVVIPSPNVRLWCHIVSAATLIQIVSQLHVAFYDIIEFHSQGNDIENINVS